ncbi:MAG: hypothetical protein ABIR68_10895 [Ilumatobacteraceae bacterium]
MAVSECSFVGEREADGEWTAEADDGEADVFGGGVASHQAIALGAIDDGAEE